MENSIHVGIAQIRAAENPARLICLGLGSCVAVALWDSSTKIGGMAHVMLPNSSTAREGAPHRPGKFGDSAVDELIREMKEMGANHLMIIAKIAGGSHMFKMVSPNMGDIGKKNVEAVREALKRHYVRVVAEDVGGATGRSVELDTNTGKLMIKSVHGGSRIL